MKYTQYNTIYDAQQTTAGAVADSHPYNFSQRGGNKSLIYQDNEYCCLGREVQEIALISTREGDIIYVDESTPVVLLNMIVGMNNDDKPVVLEQEKYKR